MSGHQASIPPTASRYFRAVGVDTLDRANHPMIAQRFSPSKGWRRDPGRKRVSLNTLRADRAAGWTHVQLTAGGHSADFEIAELLRPARPNPTRRAES